MTKISDKQLYAECKKWGKQALSARWKFQGLLPEVYKRRLYQKRGFTCIYEFAARLAGMSRDNVDQVLRLEKRFIDKPVLKQALITGKVSSNKLMRIASIATPDNQKEILSKTEKLSNRALEIFVKETRNNREKAKTTQENLHVQTLNLDSDVEKQLTGLQQKGIDINDLLRQFLKEREEKIGQELQQISNETKTIEADKNIIGYPISRHIQIKTVRILKKKFGTKCAITGCHNPSANIHHERPFAKHRTHDPKILKPLCRAHHELAHENKEQVNDFRQRLSG